MSDQPTIFQLLNAVMLDVERIGKDERVTQGPAKFAYRGVDTVVDAVGPALRKHGVVVMPELVNIAHTEFQTSSGKTQRDVVVQVRYTFYGPNGDSVSCLVAGEAADNMDKATTQAQSVAYREMWLKTLCVPSGDPDPDQYRPEAHDQPQARQAPAPQQQAPVSDADAAAVALGWPDAAKQAAFYSKLIALTDPIPDVMVAPITEWMIRNDISPTTLSFDHAKTWKGLVDDATATPTT